MRISEWISDVCSSDLGIHARQAVVHASQIHGSGRAATDWNHDQLRCAPLPIRTITDQHAPIAIGNLGNDRLTQYIAESGDVGGGFLPAELYVAGIRHIKGINTASATPQRSNQNYLPATRRIDIRTSYIAITNISIATTMIHLFLI